MSDALEKLKTLGSQKIYMDTHIPAFYVQAILDENFKELTHTQFFGFISILERDYDIDLEELQSHAREYYNSEMTTEHLGDTGVLALPPKEKNFTLLYIIIAIAIFLFAFYFTNRTAEAVHETNTTLAQANIVKPEVALQQTKEEKAVSVPQMQKTSIANKTIYSDAKEGNITTPIEEKRVKKEKVAPFNPSEPLEIIPRSRVWLGYINLATYKKYQKTFSGELDLNASQKWLFLSGHGYMDAFVNGKKIHFSTKNALRLYYKNGVLKKISKEEFKKLNRGRGW